MSTDIRTSVDNPQPINGRLLVDEFVTALDEEIETIKEGRGSNSAKIFGGRLLREIPGDYPYAYGFTLENYLSLPDESPGEIIIGAERHQGQVLTVEGLKVEFAVADLLGDTIPEARLQTDPWFLLEMLQDKLEEQFGTNPEHFKLAEQLFAGESHAVPAAAEGDGSADGGATTADGSAVPTYSSSVDPPNEAQQRAIEASFGSTLSVIWGPPGTGKTRTIAKAVEAHLNAGRRILLVSHANNAVDEALEAVAEHLHSTSLYKEGKLIRLGKPQEEHLRTLEDKYEMVLMQTITKKVGGAMLAERRQLSAEIRALDQELLTMEDQTAAAELADARYKAELRSEEITTELEKLSRKVLGEARLVATTLTQTFVARHFPDEPFDVLILDEASMAPLPHLYWAASRCREAVVIVGDFLQLPPICLAQDRLMAEKWLGRSIFDVIGVTKVEEAIADERVHLLDLQYRMSPQISAVTNRFFYGSRLRNDQSTESRPFSDGVTESSLVLVDTSQAGPWCARPANGSRFNLHHAHVCVSLAQRILNASADATVGIVTPYRAQARLISKMAKDWGLLDRTHISTVHRFQGGEESVIIFDTVEAPGERIAPMLDDTREPSAQLLLNVAMTRAKDRLYVIAHAEHLLEKMPGDATLPQIVSHFRAEGEVLSSDQLLESYTDADLIEDIEQTEEPIIVMNPSSSTMSAELVEQLRDAGATILERPRIKQSLTIVDSSVAWDQGKMRRFDGRSAVAEIIRSLELDHDSRPVTSSDPAAAQVVCPQCGERMVKRSGRFGEFFGCSGYPDCRGTVDPGSLRQPRARTT